MSPLGTGDTKKGSWGHPTPPSSHPHGDGVMVSGDRMMLSRYRTKTYRPARVTSVTREGFGDNATCPTGLGWVLQ